MATIACTTFHYFTYNLFIAGDDEIIKFLIDMNIDPFGTDDDESTFIHIAARHNQAETLQKYATEALCRTQVGDLCVCIVLINLF